MKYIFVILMSLFFTCNLNAWEDFNDIIKDGKILGFGTSIAFPDDELNLDDFDTSQTKLLVYYNKKGFDAFYGCAIISDNTSCTEFVFDEENIKNGCSRDALIKGKVLAYSTDVGFYAMKAVFLYKGEIYYAAFLEPEWGETMCYKTAG